MGTRQLAACGVAVAFAGGLARADTTETITGIGTQVGTINTHVDSVTYSDPVVVEVTNAGSAWEIRGTVSGVGWGGLGIVARPLPQAHYTYQMTWLARYPLHGGGKTLLMYHHGGGPSPMVLAQTDCLLGAGNANRFAERLGDESAGVATLVQKGTYIAANRRGLIANGRFAAKYLPSEMAPLTLAEANSLNLGLAPQCGAGYVHPDLVAGAPVPASISLDTPAVRDVDRALQQVVARISGRKFREKLSMASSAGAVATSGIAFGCSAIGATCRRTGGNYWTPYDSTSPRIFDGFLFSGFVYNSATPRADASQPISAPVFILQGRGDERLLQPIHMAYELLQKGVTLDGSIWLYEEANMPHIARDSVLAAPPPGDNGEALSPYFGAALRNMRELLAGEAAPPTSRISGHIVNGGLVYDVVGGTTIEMPIREWPTRDGLDFDTADIGNQIVLLKVDQGIYTGASGWWQAVTAVLPVVNQEIVGPSIACRIGAYRLRFMGTALTPYTPAELAAEYGSFDGYRDCIKANVHELADENLYDPKVETIEQTAERAHTLFAE